MASTPPRPTLPFAGTPHPQRRLREEGAPGQQSVWASLHSLLGQGEQRSLAGADPEDARVSFEGKKKETWKCKVNADKSRGLRRPEPGGSGSMRRCPRGGGALSSLRVCRRLQLPFWRPRRWHPQAPPHSRWRQKSGARGVTTLRGTLQSRR